jgi:hypothetical protein
MEDAMNNFAAALDVLMADVRAGVVDTYLAEGYASQIQVHLYHLEDAIAAAKSARRA